MGSCWYFFVKTVLGLLLGILHWTKSKTSNQLSKGEESVWPSVFKLL